LRLARPPRELDLDSLYRLPPDEFIAARNALARTAGSAAAEVKALAKPTLPAWAVNQLYWQERDAYTALLARAGDLRATHHAALRGERGDLRGASRAHEEAVDTALKATLALLAASGHPLTDATRQAVATTLRSLPSDDPPGRLTRPLQPRGFESLAGAAPGGRVRALPPAEPARKTSKPASSRRGAKEGTAAADGRAVRLAAAREAVAAAGRAVREAEQLARREEFEAARATRDAEKAQRHAAAAEEALKQAEAELQEAKTESARSAAARDSAQARADKAATALEAARDREETARRDRDALA
jgi:hypothetical protein